jgi:integrase
LDTRSARAKLSPRAEPYWTALAPGRHLGYRRLGTYGGTWIAKMRDPASGQRSKRSLGPADDALDADGARVLTFAQAQEKARAWFATPRAGDGAEARPAEAYTVEHAMRDYLDWLAAHRKPEAVKVARWTVEAHISPALGSVPLASLTPAKLRAWHEALASAPARLRTRKDAPAQRTRAPAASTDQRRARRATANRILTVLKAALNRAWHAGHAATDEGWRTAKPFRKADGSRVRYLRRDEIGRLLNACGPDFRRLVRGALLTGARYGELCRATVGDFDPDTGTLHVREAKADRPRHVPARRRRAGVPARGHGRPGARRGAVPAGGRPALEGEPPEASDRRGQRRGQAGPAGHLPQPAPHLGQPPGHGGRAAHGRGPGARAREHPHGGAALRPPRAQLRARRGPRHRARDRTRRGRGEGGGAPIG